MAKKINQDQLNQHSMGVIFTWEDIGKAFMDGVKEGLKNPGISKEDIRRGVDGYCKLIQLRKFKE